MINEIQAKKYCCEDISNIENYDKAVADKTQTWICHHKLEIKDLKIFSRQLLINDGMYYKRPAAELIFMTKSQHHKLHSLNMSLTWHSKLSKNAKTGGMTGKKHSEQSKKKMSESHKGLKSPNKGNHFSHTDQAKKKMSESHKGKVWINNGVKSTLCCPENIPSGWKKGRLK